MPSQPPLIIRHPRPASVIAMPQADAGPSVSGEGSIIEREGLRPATAAKMASLWQRPSSDGDASQARRQFLNSEEISREHLFRRTCQERVLTSATRTRMALNGAVPVTRRRAVGPRKQDNVWPSGHDHLGETNMTMMLAINASRAHAGNRMPPSAGSR